MTTPVNRSTTSSSSSVSDTSTTETTSKNQTGGTTEDPAAQGAQTVTNPSQLSGISQGQIDQALRMSGNSPYVTLRAPDGSLLVVEKNLLFAWGFASPQQGQGAMGESGDPGAPYEDPLSGDAAMYQQWQDGGGVGNPQGFGTAGKNMTGGGATGYYYGPGGYVGGGSSGPGGYGNPYAGYGQPGNPIYDQVFGGEQRDQVYAQRREIRKAESQLKVKMRTIMLMIMMGDVVGAMRAMVFESEKLNKMFNRQLVKQLNTVRESKAKILNAMARKDPPRAHDNTNNPQGAANDQNKQAKYTQWVSVTTQLMSEVQQTERELMDLLSEGRRNINESWEAYSGMKEAEARTTRTVIQAFRS